MLDSILGTKQEKNKDKDKKIKCSNVFSILKGAPQIDPASLNPSQERDFSALKAAVMLMGLPIGQIDDYMSRLWQQYQEIGRLNKTVHGNLYIVYMIKRFHAEKT